MVHTVFFTGATGYVGGSVLYEFLQRDDIKDFDITLLVRSKEKAAGFEELGLKTVIGSIDDLDLITEQCSKSDITFNSADCDNYAFNRAMIKGFQKYKQQNGKPPALLHTSGTGVIVIDAQGRAPKPEDPVYVDADPKSIESIPKDNPHREGDIDLVEADERGDVLTYILLPSTIYGEATNKLGKGQWQGKLMNTRSRQMPREIIASIKRGKPGFQGEGKNVWPHVHIEDLVKLYSLVFSLTKEGKGDHGRNGYYFGAAGHYEYYQVAQAIGKAIEKRGKGQATPAAYEPGELEKEMGDFAWYVGSTGQAEAPHSLSLGWKPKYNTQDFYDALDEETEAQIALMAKGNVKTAVH